MKSDPLIELATLHNEHGIEYTELTPYQIRIENTLDIYPVKRKWHNIRSGKRGEYKRLIPFLISFFQLPLAIQCPKCRHSFFKQLQYTS